MAVLSPPAAETRIWEGPNEGLWRRCVVKGVRSIAKALGVSMAELSKAVERGE